MRPLRVFALVLGVAAPLALLAACGARSGLFLLPAETYANDAAPGAFDDVVLPGIDVQPQEDVVEIPQCADASDTLIYVVTTSNSLLKFNPPSAQFSFIGTLNCPDPYGRAPFSMAVDREGNAYVLYFAPPQNDDAGLPLPGSIFKVDLNNAACETTGFVPGQQGLLGFGMGFAADPTTGGETLFVAAGFTTTSETSTTLAAVNETTLSASIVGTLPSFVLGTELTGTGDGRLFGFYSPSWATDSANDGPTYIAQIDPATATVIAQDGPLPGVTEGGGWAFAFWGGSFYTFTAPVIDDQDPTSSIVQRYNPADGTVVDVATYPEVIDGAGVSTCAPVQ
jgi:hypothetical protein